MKFEEMVMACFDNKEFVSNWERLRKKKCRGKKNMELFIEDIKNTVWDRIPKKHEPYRNPYDCSRPWERK